MNRLKLYGPLMGVIVAVFVLGPLSPALAALVGAGGLLGWVVMTNRRSQRGAAINNQGLTLMGEGRLVEAIAAFNEARSLLFRSPLPTFNIGLASLWLWRLEEARLNLETATTSRAGAPLRVIASPALFLIATLQNDSARGANYEAELKPLGCERSSVAHVARAVRFARARNWPEVLGALTLANMRPLGGPARAIADAIRAWALVESGGTCPPIDHVGVFGETGPDAVRKWWPEFADFLERTGTKA